MIFQFLFEGNFNEYFLYFCVIIFLFALSAMFLYLFSIFKNYFCFLQLQSFSFSYISSRLFYFARFYVFPYRLNFLFGFVNLPSRFFFLFGFTSTLLFAYSFLLSFFFSHSSSPYLPPYRFYISLSPLLPIL